MGKGTKKIKNGLTEEQTKKRRASVFKRKIRNVFTNSGFDYLNTINVHMTIGRRTVEVDAVFFYENIFLVCEDTTGAKDKDHIRNKNEAASEIDNNFSIFVSQLSQKLPDAKEKLDRYSADRYLRFYLYFSLEELVLSSDEIALYNNLKFVAPKTLDYFSKIVQCIKFSARYEIFRYLGIEKSQIGVVSSGSGRTRIKAPIIYPKVTTGLKNDVRIVSFMMSADTLLGTCYVLRKDNWEESMWLYQRLIEKEKIKKIRNFLFHKSETFFNNIIVALPDNVNFTDTEGHPISIDEIANFANSMIELPDEMNSIGVIDGQHRIFAHHEGPKNDGQETKIAILRKQLHLLVTGLVFPPTMQPLERLQIQSEIFLDINSNAKPIKADVLLQIEMIKDPFSDIGLARRVIEKLNKKGVFCNKFEMSSLDESKIKIASIVKFALRYLVSLTPVAGREGLFEYWPGEKSALRNKDEAALNEYIEFCASILDTYFSAVKNNNKSQWHERDSKLLSVTAINGFIIAYNRQLKANGVKDFDFHDKMLKKLKVDYSQSEFPYTSSQYRKFSDQIVRDAFGLDINEV